MGNTQWYTFLWKMNRQTTTNVWKGDQVYYFHEMAL